MRGWGSRILKCGGFLDYSHDVYPAPVTPSVSWISPNGILLVVCLPFTSSKNSRLFSVPFLCLGCRGNKWAFDIPEQVSSLNQFQSVCIPVLSSLTKKKNKRQLAFRNQEFFYRSVLHSKCRIQSLMFQVSIMKKPKNKCTYIHG